MGVVVGKGGVMEMGEEGGIGGGKVEGVVGGNDIDGEVFVVVGIEVIDVVEDGDVVVWYIEGVVVGGERMGGEGRMMEKGKYVGEEMDEDVFIMRD